MTTGQWLFTKTQPGLPSSRRISSVRCHPQASRGLRRRQSRTRPGELGASGGRPAVAGPPPAVCRVPLSVPPTKVTTGLSSRASLEVRRPLRDADKGPAHPPPANDRWRAHLCRRRPSTRGSLPRPASGTSPRQSEVRQNFGRGTPACTVFCYPAGKRWPDAGERLTRP